MAAPKKPYEQFGPFILFKKLEADSHGELWRAARFDGGQLGATLALRRLTGGNRQALGAAAEYAQTVVAQLHGTSFARDQVLGTIDQVPYLAWDYAGGRSLRHIIDRARGGKDSNPNPLPLDQAIVIAEKVALSLATMGELRDPSGNRLLHGALIPQFIWISDDGEIRVAGQQLGTGLVASLGDPKVAADIGRYFALEYRTTGAPSKASEVYALGAILFLLVTGQEPPDNMTASAFTAAIRAAKTTTGTPVPDDIRVILDKSFNLDPSMRYASAGDMKQALSALANGGKYSATTFNLAFYLSNLLKREMEGETAEREKEAKVNLAPYLESPRATAPVPLPEDHVPSPAPFAAHADAAPKRSKLPLAVAAVVVLGLLGAGGYFMLRKSSAQPSATQVTQASTMSSAATVPVAPRIISEPVLASPAATATSTTGTVDSAAAQQAAFELAVKQKLNAEMMKLQTNFTEELKKTQSKHAPVATAPAPAPAVAEAAPSAAQLDQQRRETVRQDAPVQQAAAPAVIPQVQQQAAPVPQPAAPAPAPVQQVTSVREGDVVDVGSLDVLPRPTRPIRPNYPPMAARQRISATVILSALVSETGQVLDVRVLRGFAGFGINDAAVYAMKSTKFSAPMKDGKRVRTWFPQTIEFKP
jgi:TonB family protein